MMIAPKSTASLSSGLLARKGHARPAMRPQGYLNLAPSAPQDDLGWNDMGEESIAPVETPIEKSIETIVPEAPLPTAEKPAVLRQIEALDETFASPPAEAKPIAGKKARAAFTLRLDPERHLRLRLASALTRRSAQQLVTAALDAFLESMDEVETLARQVDPAKDQGRRSR